MAIREMLGFEDFPAGGDYTTLALLGKGITWSQGTSGKVSSEVVNDRRRLAATSSGAPYLTFWDSAFFALNDLKTRKVYFGFRYQVPNDTLNTTQPVVQLAIYSGAGSNSYSPVLDNDIVNGLEAYIEICLDIPNKTLTSWIDGVKVRDLAINDFTLSLTKIQFFVGQLSGASTTQNYTYNDFYFMVDTSDLDGGTTPSTRLGPIKVRSLVPDTVALGDGWTNPGGGDPVANLAVSTMDQTHKTTPAIRSSTNRSATLIGLSRPANAFPIKAVSVRVFGYRDSGTAPVMVGNVVQGTNQTAEATMTLNPNTPKEQAAVDSLGVFNSALDGTPWTADKVDLLQVRLYTKVGD